MIADVAGAAVALVLVPVMTLAAAVLHGPSGYLALLAPRRTRAGYRYRLAHRRWRPKPRRKQKSARISDHMRAVIYHTDRYRCAGCRQRGPEVRARGDTLQIDHMIPWSWGGLTCIWNSAVLCGRCNKIKGTVFTDDGKTRGRSLLMHRSDGARIYRAEIANRMNPWRCARALIAMATVK